MSKCTHFQQHHERKRKGSANPFGLDTKGPTQQGELETVAGDSCLPALQPARPPKAQQEPTWQLVSTDSPKAHGCSNKLISSCHLMHHSLFHPYEEHSGNVLLPKRGSTFSLCRRDCPPERWSLSNVAVRYLIKFIVFMKLMSKGQNMLSPSPQKLTVTMQGERWLGRHTIFSPNFTEVVNLKMQVLLA